MWVLVVDLDQWVTFILFYRCAQISLNISPCCPNAGGFLYVNITTSRLPAGGWWRLWCVLYNCWGEPHHIPHLLQVLLPRHSKSTKWHQHICVWVTSQLAVKTQLCISLSLLMPHCVTCRTHTGLVSTSGRPWLISRPFSSLKTIRRLWSIWKMGKSTYNGHCAAVDSQEKPMSVFAMLLVTGCTSDLFFCYSGHILGAGHSTLSDRRTSCYSSNLFLFIHYYTFQNCVVLVPRERCDLYYQQNVETYHQFMPKTVYKHNIIHQKYLYMVCGLCIRRL